MIDKPRQLRQSIFYGREDSGFVQPAESLRTFPEGDCADVTSNFRPTDHFRSLWDRLFFPPPQSAPSFRFTHLRHPSSPLNIRRTCSGPYLALICEVSCEVVQISIIFPNAQEWWRLWTCGSFFLHFTPPRSCVLLGGTYADHALDPELVDPSMTHTTA